MLDTTRKQVEGLIVLLLFLAVGLTLHYTNHREVASPVFGLTWIFGVVLILRVWKHRKRAT
jgi:hypothetical protein